MHDHLLILTHITRWHSVYSFKEAADTKTAKFPKFKRVLYGRQCFAMTYMTQLFQIPASKKI